MKGRVEKMTDFEMLQAILDEIKGVKGEVTEFKCELKEFKDEVNARFNQVDARFNQVDARLDTIEARLDTVESRLANIEADVKQNTIEMETVLEQCMKAYSNSCVANREKIDSLNIDGLRYSINSIELRQSLLENKIARLERKVG